MASTYSTLKIELIGTGEQAGTWGTTTNTNLGTAIEEAIVGSVDVSFSSADVTLTLTNTNATQSARNLRLNLTGTSGGARNLVLGSGCQIDKPYLINNGLADTVTVKNTTGNGIAVPAGKTMWVYNNGTDVVDAVTHLSSLTLSTALPVASGGTGGTTESAARTGLGATTVGSNFFTLTNPSAIRFPRINADNTVSALSDSDFRTAIGAGTGSGTVTSVAVSGGTTGLTTSGGPITTSGTITIAGTLAVTNGGTGITTVAQGDILYGSAANTIVVLPKNTTATRYLANTGSSNNPAWAQIDLTNGVTGDLPFSNLAQGSALSVLGVTGNATADVASIAAGTDHQVLRRSGTSVAFGAVNLAQSAAITGNLPLANGGTGASLTDPNADRILFWDDSAGAVTFLTAGTGLSISGTTITATGGSGTVTSVSGTGSAYGITLSGTVTTSGSITLSGSSYTSNNVLLGNGTSAFQVVAPSTSGNVLTSNGSTWTSAAPAVSLSANNAFTGANTFYNGTGQTFGTGTSTQDGIIIAGRAGGSSTRRITLAPADLSDNRTLTLPDPGSNETIGYLNIPQVSQSAAYTLVATDSGKHILHPSADTTARTFTIPANSSVPYAVGTAITFVNQNGAGVVTIAITTDTMRLAGAGTTGSRTLAANGIATAIKLTSTEWIISGTGLT